MRRWLILPLLLLPVPALAQSQAEEDRGFLTAFLEDNLSDAGRTVTITGFEGALSSRATIRELTIADAQGVWLTLRGVVFDWNRSALFAGEVAVDELSAEHFLTNIERLQTLSNTLKFLHEYKYSAHFLVSRIGITEKIEPLRIIIS